MKRLTWLIIGILLLIPIASALTGTDIGAYSNPTGNPLGGGAGYSDIILSNNASITSFVENASQLGTACNVTTAGHIIYINSTAQINLTGMYDVCTGIREGVTLASDRGNAGSAGGLIFVNRMSSYPTTANYVFTVRNNSVRITGLRWQGDYGGQASTSGVGSVAGIHLRNYKGFVVDNNEIYNWSLAGVALDVWSTTLSNEGLTTAELGSSIANVHHNYIHHCQSDGFGYGVAVLGYGSALIKGNVFDWTRHMISGGGVPVQSYEASYNVHLGNTNGAWIDVHGYNDTAGNHAGTTYIIHHNTIKMVTLVGSPITTYNENAVQMRGTPDNRTYVYNNYFRFGGHSSASENAPNLPWHSPIMQWGYRGFGNITSSNNYYNYTFYQTLAARECPASNPDDWTCGGWAT
jgi:hypothetical protein